MISIRDVIIKDDRPTDLLLQKHEKYLKHYASEDAGTEQIMAEYIKMSGMYWGLNALYLMTTLEDQSPDVSRALDFIKQCQNKDGGFAAAQRHDSHILHTLSAVQILVILNKCNSHYIDIEKCVSYVSSLQQKDGSFFGDKWGEVDTRFSFCALATLKLLKRLDAINMEDAVKFVMSCNNQIDGGFGSKPGSESHSAYVYCCIGCLSIAGQLHRVDVDQLGQWLSERQLPSGGLNGRPEKLPDVCYSWWCLSSMKMINRMHLINHERLLKFILACQDEEQGGFSDRPGNWVDPFHTVFGLASMSLICYHFDEIDNLSDKEADGDTENSAKKNFFNILRKLRTSLKRVDPTLCMPEEILERHHIST